MNAVYRVVWNAASGQWVVASELAKGRKKKSMSRAIVAALTVAVVGVGAGAASRVQAMDAIGNGAVQGNAANTVIGDSAQGNAACGTLLMPGTACSTVVGNSAKSTGFASVAMGDHAESGQLSTAIGSYAKSGTYSQAIGADAQATGGWATAIGQGARATFRDTTAIGTNARSLAERATAIGSGANANSNDSFAIGWSSNATGAGSMAFGTSVTVAGVNAIALGLGSTATADNTVALGANSVANRVNTISVGAAGTERQIVNVAAGVEDTDAVNVSQLKPVIGAIGGGAAIDPITGVVTGPTYNVGGNTYNNVGDALTNVDGRTTVNEGDITNLKSGTVGLVTQADANAVVNVATASGGTSVNFAGTAGDRQLRGVGAGVVDNDAVNIGQLKPVIDGIGGGATIDPVTGVVTGPTYNIGGNTYNNVGDALTNVDGRTTINEGDILNLKNGTSGLVTQSDPNAVVNVATTSGGTSVNFAGSAGDRQLKGVGAGVVDNDAVNISQLKPVIDGIGGGATIDPVTGVVTGPTYNIGGNTYNNVGDALTNVDGRTTVNEGDILNLKNGTLGLVTQADANAVVNVATATGGTSVNFAGTAGDRQLKGVAEGTAGNDGVNVTQLRREIAGVSAGDTRYFKADGKNDDTDDAQVIGNNSVAIGAGSVAARDNSVDVGNRQITGVVAGTADTDAVNVSQLKGAGLIGGDGSVLDAVVYDAGSNRGAVTFGGTAGTRLTNVMAGLVAPGSMDAINGSQLWAVQDQVNKLGDRVTNIEIGGGTGPVIPVTPERPIGEGGGRDPHFASSGDATKPAQATGDNAAAVGAGSVADRDNTVSVGSKDNERQVTNVAAGTQETDAANWGQVQDALRTANGYTDDRFNTLDRRIDKVGRKANAGVASALAAASMPQAYAPGLNSVGVGVGSYGGQSAIAIGASTISESGRWVFKVNGTSSTNGEKGVGAGAAMVW
jgi:autotransporter adhesin